MGRVYCLYEGWLRFVCWLVVFVQGVFWCLCTSYEGYILLFTSVVVC